jgi:hypothetical protein
VYLTSGGDNENFIEEFRIQNLEQIDKAILRQFAERIMSPKFKRAVQNIEKIIDRGEGVDL